MVPNFVQISAPLDLKLGKGQSKKFESLNEEEFTALKKIQEKLVTPTVLAFNKKERKFVVDTDECDQEVGGVFLKEQK